MTLTDVLDRVAASVVEMEVPDRDGRPFRCPGVALDPRGASAWGALHDAPADFKSLAAVAVRQGGRKWTGSVDIYLADWAACAVSTEEPFGLPVVAARRSRDLESLAREGGELAVVGCRDGEPVAVGNARLTRAAPLKAARDRPFERSLVWFLRPDRVPDAGGCLAFDGDGRFAGVLEPPDAENSVPLIPAEYFTNLTSVPFFSMLLDLHEYRQLARDFLRWKDRFTDPEPFCMGGLAFEALGQHDGALAAWRVAASLDPANPWTLDAIARALTNLGRADEAAEWRERSRAIRRDE